jgi:hypothetical protein
MAGLYICCADDKKQDCKNDVQQVSHRTYSSLVKLGRRTRTFEANSHDSSI